MSNHERETRRIVVGVDGSVPSQRALEWALRQAEYEDSLVVAVLAWQIPATYGAGAMLMPPEDFALEAKAALAAAVDAAAAARPEARIERAVVEGNPAKALLDQAKDADLLVVGSRGHGGFVGALLGSVSHHVIHHAPCPVVVIRGEQ